MDMETIIELMNNIYNYIVSQYNIVVPNTQAIEAMVANAQSVIANSNINSLRLQDWAGLVQLHDIIVQTKEEVEVFTLFLTDI